MSRYRSKPKEIEAVQWFPDPGMATFDAVGGYHNHRIGYDFHGVNYTITQVGVFTRSGWASILPGDFLVKETDGIHHRVIEKNVMATEWERIV